MLSMATAGVPCRRTGSDRRGMQWRKGGKHASLDRRGELIAIEAAASARHALGPVSRLELGAEAWEFQQGQLGTSHFDECLASAPVIPSSSVEDSCLVVDSVGRGLMGAEWGRLGAFPPFCCAVLAGLT